MQYFHTLLLCYWMLTKIKIVPKMTKAGISMAEVSLCLLLELLWRKAQPLTHHIFNILDFAVWCYSILSNVLIFLSLWILSYRQSLENIFWWKDHTFNALRCKNKMIRHHDCLFATLRCFMTFLQKNVYLSLT